MSQLYAGAARVCIDPPAEMFPFPSNFSWMDEVRDPCHVRALAVKNDDRTILFVVYEMADLPGNPDLIPELSKASGVPEKDIIVAATHNHTSPNDRSKMVKDADDKFAFFRKYAVDQGCAAVKKAVAELRPAKYGYGETDSYCNVNRDKKTAFGFWVEGPNYEGYSNKTLAVMKFTDMEGKVIACLLNYGAHAVCAFVQKDTDGKIKSSCNFPGIACLFVEKYYGDDCVCLWTSGCAGNQDPILFDHQWKEYEDGYVTDIHYPDGIGYLNMDILGAQHGADALRCIENIKDLNDDLSVKYIKSIVPIQARKKDPNFKIPPFGLRMGGVGERTNFDPPVYPELPTFIVDEGKFINYELDLLQLGNVNVFLTSGELYAEIGRDIMKESGADNTFVITHIPGEGGYTLDRSSKDHKVFQAFGNVEPGSTDEPLIERAKELVKQAGKKN